MPDNRNTEKENPPLDTEDWEIALAPYKGNPGAALQLGYHFIALLAYLRVEPVNVETATNAIDRALLVLYPHTEFHMVCWTFFRKVIEGELTLEEEEVLKKLGIKF
jgi:hypothetical protein